MGPPGKVKFGDGTLVTRAAEYEYLGVILQEQGDIRSEILHRLRKASATWRKLGDYWQRSRATKRQKMIVYNAIIKSKIMYGLESAHLTTTWMNRLNTFQLRGLRKILRMVTTFVDRANTNEEVLRRADKCLKKGKRVEMFSVTHTKRRIKLAAHLLRRHDHHPGRSCAYKPGTATPITNPKKRVGRPKIRWTDATHEHAWLQIAETIGEEGAEPDAASQWQQGWINLMANARMLGQEDEAPRGRAG